MNNRTKFPAVYIIDGTDGCGKKTITSKIVQMVEDHGLNVGMIEPPFYDTPSGQIVQDYLYNGYGDITDRRIASQLYAADRNLWMKDHFNEYFLSGKYDIIIYNRSWISNILYQTTVRAQQLSDTMAMRLYIDFFDFRLFLADIAAYFYEKTRKNEANYIAHPFYHFSDLDIGNSFSVYEAIYHISKKTNLSENSIAMTLWHTYFTYRSQMVYDSILVDYLNEIDTWRISALDHAPFTSLIEGSIIISPTCNKDAIAVIDQNLMKRYNGDATKKDRNESDMRYQAAVVENIHFINTLLNMLQVQKSSNDFCKTSMAPLSVNAGIFGNSMRYEIFKPFNFDIIHNTDGQNNLRSIDDITEDILHKWNFISK